MSEITRWEYRILTFGSALSGAKDEELKEILDEWGEEGWEVISAHHPESSNKVRIIAKRLLTSSARRSRSYPV